MIKDRPSTRSRITRRLTFAGVVGATIAGLLPLGVGVASATPRASAAATGGQYNPVTPVRIADTRSGSGFGNAGQTMQAGGSVTVALPASVAGASAVALNVTATNTTGSGFFTVYPAGGTLPLASSLNYAPGANVPNFVIVPVGSNNSITIYNGPASGTGGAADAVVDLQGYFSTIANTSGGAGHFTPLTPARITDTRAGSGQTNAGSTLSAGGSLNVQATGVGGVPATGVSAVEVNVTEAGNTAGGFLTVYPQGNTAPTVSNLNFTSGQIIANRVIVPVNPANGQFSIFNHAGSTDVVVDVDGYFTDSTGASGAGSLFNPVTPARVIDTRSTSPIGPGGNLNVPIAGKNGVPTGATAAVLNVTEADNTAGGFLTVSPSAPAPTASDINFVPKVIVANGDLAALASDGSLNVFNHAGNTDVVLDVAGYFTPATPVNTNQTLAVSPTNAQNVTVSTASNSSQGVTTYTVSGLGTSTANIALFACTGADAPTGSNGQTTFSSTGGSGVAGNAKGEGGTQSNPGGELTGGNPGITTGTVGGSSATAYIASVNGVPTANAAGGQGQTIIYGITPNNGSVSFVLNSFAADCAIPVVYTAPTSAGTNPPLAVGTSGAPASGYTFGVGGQSVFNAAPAGAGNYPTYVVQSVNPANSTFQAKPVAGGTTLTFTYGQSGSTYNYSETPGTNGTTTSLPISAGQFATYVSGVTVAAAGPPATPASPGDELNIAYGGSTNPSTFSFVGVDTNGIANALANGDVPAAPASPTATYQTAVTTGPAANQHPAGVLVSWTAPANPDVFSYQVQVATFNTSGVLSAFANAGNGDAVVSGTYNTAANAGVVAGAQNASGVVTSAPPTAFFDPNQAGGAKAEYRVIAIADNNNNAANSPASVATAPVTVVATATANVTGPLSTSTSYTPKAAAATMAPGDTVDVNFNSPVSVSSSWSVEVVDAAGNEALLNSTDATASTANGGTTVIVQIGVVGSNTSVAPIVVANGLPATAAAPGAAWELLSAGGINGTGTGTPTWNVEASGANGAVIENSTSTTVTRELVALSTGASAGAVNNTTAPALPAAPAVTLNGASSTSGTPNTINTTCTAANDSINIYAATGTLLGSITCTATGATNYAIPSSITVTSGNTYIVGISPVAAPVYNNASAKGQESQTVVTLAS